MSAYHARDIHPHGQPYCHEHLPEPFAKGKGDGYDEQYCGDRPHHIYEPHYQVVDPAAIVCGHGSKRDAYKQCDGNGDKAHREAYTASNHNLAEQVASVGVSAENESEGRDFNHLVLMAHMSFSVVGCRAGIRLIAQAVAKVLVGIYGYGCVLKRLTGYHSMNQVAPLHCVVGCLKTYKCGF